ncbi:PREDICTED: glycoprotein integral membrane protein 1-like [Branchiostoma belcheri]|uniref:Glycoprotein integral membrane protein 1-like n=1 Tax=Branchiostoma belcheri TaxID=7741 RepID=A0A6P5A3J4_BRABE|nr:PREDICTED: glycoprotein integral membrane protein 1-like [Branchiostoma belcheri]
MAARRKMLLFCAVFSSLFLASLSATVPLKMPVENATSPMAAVKMEKALEETILVEVQEEALAEQIPGELEDKVIKVELKLAVHKGQVKVNDLPVITPGITHLTCSAQIFQPSSGGKLIPQGTATVGVRLLVLQRGAKQLHIEEEVTSVNGTTVLQGVVQQVLIVLSEKQKELKRMVSHVQLEHSKVHQLSADSEVHVAKQVVKTSTMGHAEMTSNQQEAVDIAPEISTEEVAAPGKLPETPLRADPPAKPITFHSLCSRMEELKNQMCVTFRRMCDEFNLQSFYVRLLTLCMIGAMTVLMCLACVKAFCPAEELTREDKIKLGLLCEGCELKQAEETNKALKYYGWA